MLVFSRHGSHVRYSQTISPRIVKVAIFKVLNKVIFRGFDEAILIDIHNN